MAGTAADGTVDSRLRPASGDPLQEKIVQVMPIKKSSGSDTESGFHSYSDTLKAGTLFKSEHGEKDSRFASKDNISFSNTDSDTCIHCTSVARTKNVPARKKRSQSTKSDSNNADLKNKIQEYPNHEKEPDIDKGQRHPIHNREQSDKQTTQNRCTQQEELQSSYGLCRQHVSENCIVYPTLSDRKLQQTSDSLLGISEAISTVFPPPSFCQKGRNPQQLYKTQNPEECEVNLLQTLKTKPQRYGFITHETTKQEHLDSRTTRCSLDSKQSKNPNFNCLSSLPSHNCVHKPSPRQSKHEALDFPKNLPEHQFTTCSCSDEDSSIVITLTLDTGKLDTPEEQSDCVAIQSEDLKYSNTTRSKGEELVSLGTNYIPPPFEEHHSGQHANKCTTSASPKYNSLSSRLRNNNVSSNVYTGGTQFKSILSLPNKCSKTSECSLHEYCQLKNKLSPWRSSNCTQSRNCCFKRKLNLQHLPSAAKEFPVSFKKEIPHSSEESIWSSQFQMKEKEMEAVYENKSDDQHSVCEVCYSGSDGELSQLSEGEKQPPTLHGCHKNAGCTTSQELLDFQDSDHDLFCKCGRVPQYGLFPSEPITQPVTPQTKKAPCTDSRDAGYEQVPRDLSRLKHQLTAAAQKPIKPYKYSTVSNHLSSEEDVHALMNGCEHFNNTQSYFEFGSGKKTVHQRNDIDWVKKEALTKEESIENARPLIVKEDGDTADRCYFGIKLKDGNLEPNEEEHISIKHKEHKNQLCSGMHLASSQGMCSYNLNPTEKSWDTREADNRTRSDQIEEMAKTDDEQSCAFCDNFYKFGLYNNQD